ncbi:hypothetical protein ARZXY2_1332 [Arthrobacter sp. ZXY-2]|nr:hypothetical protein ARZXY2_1332 [Arthrobacter sp. ZXY-2]
MVHLGAASSRAAEHQALTALTGAIAMGPASWSTGLPSYSQ